MGSVSNSRQHITRADIANIPKPLTSRATYASVSNPPLDQKVEMTNWEKVSDGKSTKIEPSLMTSRVTTSTTSKNILSADSRSRECWGWN